MNKVLDIQNLDVTFATSGAPVRAVNGLYLDVREGEILALVGESGSGKTVTSKSILGLLPSNALVEGAVLLRGQDVVSMNHRQLRQMRGQDAAMIFQEPSSVLNPVYTIGWQMMEGLRAHVEEGGKKLSKAQAKAQCIEALEKVGIADATNRFDYYPHQFSGGQKQRIVIAMALVLGAKLLIADEPTTALDVTVQAEILDLLRDVRDKFGASILLITHNMGVVADLADRVAVMYRGDLVETGAVKQIFHHPTHEYTRSLLAAVPRLKFDEFAARDAAERAAQEAEAARTDAAEQDWMIRVAATTAPLVVAQGLEITYPGRLGQPDFKAVDGVSFAIHPREVLGLVGESGSGKTTIGRAIAGLTAVTGGSLQVFDTEMRGVKERNFRPVRPRIGFVFQDPATSFNPLLTIAECIAEPLLVHKRARNIDAAMPRVKELLDAVHLPRSFASRFPHELSGGQRQRASLARALALEPELLIADEPTSALDVSVQAQVLEVFQELQARLHFATLFITHDLAVVGMLADRIGVLQHGKLVEIGTVAAVLGNPQQPYTQRLLASVPVPDPEEQARRRTALQQLVS